MSLKGSLQTVALPEVLRFLSGTGKSGEFYVSGTNGDGRLWFSAGRISAFQAGRAAEPYEAIFEMLRISDGDFDFTADSERPLDAHAVDSVDLDSTIEAAEQRMAEWVRIVDVVPSLAHRVSLKSEAPGERVELAAEQWSTVVTISHGGTVGEVIDARGLQEFDGCAALRDLIQAGLVEISEPAGMPAEVAELDTAEATSGVAGCDAPAAVDVAVIGEVADVEPAGEAFGFEPVLAVEPIAAATTPADEFGVEPAFSFESALHAEAAVEPAAAESEAVAFDDDAIPGQLLRFGSEPEAPITDKDVETDPAADDTVVESVEAAPAVDETGTEAGEDHYAALRAAMVELGENLSVEEDPSESEPGNSTVYELNAEPELDGRAALHALLSEVTAPEAPVSTGEPVDGLADRGPWTDHELSAMEAGRPEEEGSNIVPFAPVQTAVGDGELPAAGSDAEHGDESEATEEPINRGLLLKFLSSVRN